MVHRPVEVGNCFRVNEPFARGRLLMGPAFAGVARYEDFPPFPHNVVKFEANFGPVCAVPGRTVENVVKNPF